MLGFEFSEKSSNLLWAHQKAAGRCSQIVRKHFRWHVTDVFVFLTPGEYYRPLLSGSVDGLQVFSDYNSLEIS